METKLNIYQRLNAVMQEVKYIQKDPKKEDMKYATMPHDKVIAKLREPMTNHGIAFIPTIKEYRQEGNRTQVLMEARFVNIDDPNDFCTASGIGYGVDNSDKGPGKATSYACKYILLKTFCLETGEDPENDQNSVYEEKEEKQIRDVQVKALEHVCKDYPEILEEIKVKYNVKDISEITSLEFPRAIVKATESVRKKSRPITVGGKK